MIAIDEEFRKSAWYEDHLWDVIGGAGDLRKSDIFFCSNCFLGNQSIVRPIYGASIYLLEDGEEMSYALRDTFEKPPDLTNEERLKLECQMQAYAQEKNLRYSYLYSHGFAVFAFTNEEPELWVNEVREAYNRRPEIGRNIGVAEVRLQHQVLIEHTLLEMFDWAEDKH